MTKGYSPVDFPFSTGTKWTRVLVYFLYVYIYFLFFGLGVCVCVVAKTKCG